MKGLCLHFRDGIGIDGPGIPQMEPGAAGGKLLGKRC